jgi:hypothetical protein
MGKGDKRRPRSTYVTEEEHAERWRKTFEGDMTCLHCGSRFWHDQWSRCPKCYGEGDDNKTSEAENE